ncbi:hypothetical protein DSL72_002730 [Monilinia vaccinii-corymbosi]|uniref:Nuclear RNA binding protein n=1 Tax=Monilinia vaccinii-corymbosi TaxID=61207 RepID=A0A8A3PDI5_9HELO|nr:hypothetical protein DSL72_002730 [Monilinia vaccinii-corymbosi]
MESYKTPRRQSMDHPMGESPFDDARHSIDSRTGSKRSYSNRNARPTILADDGEGGTILGPAFDNDEEYPDEKRHRSENWPLPPAPIEHGVAPPSRAPSRARSRTSRRSTASPPPRRPSLHRSRPSRFLEGSMNDKVSQLPPTPYLYHEEELRERYIEDELMGKNGQTSPGRKMAKPRGFMQPSNKSMTGESSVAGISDTSRHSTIFRFGSKIAASIKPSNWKIFSKSPKVQEETPQQKAVRERQEKAEKMYHELKANGFFRDGAIIQQPGFKPGRHSMDQTPRFKHDSGVELNDKYHSRENSPTEDKRHSREIASAQEFYHDSPISKLSAPTDASTPRSVFHRKAPSMSNLRNVPSREWMARPASTDPQSARKIPSRKEFQKQQKLVKRVSDLEVKLEEARRQLTDTFAEPLADEQIYQPPDFEHQQSYQQSYQQPYHQQLSHSLPPPPPDRYGRARFVPGALATLPSERLLSGYLDPEVNFNEDEDFHNIGKAITTQDSMDRISTGPTDLLKTNQIQHPTTVADEGSEYVLSSVESENETSDSRHSQSVVTSRSANGARVVEVNSTSSRIISQVACIEERKAPEAKTFRLRAIKKKSVDNDRTFRPTPDSESESDSGPDLKARPLRKVRSSRNRKLINEISPYTGPSTSPKRVSSDDGRKSVTHTAPTHGVEKSILVKLKIPKDSPPAKTNSDTLNYFKTRMSPVQQSQSEDAVVDQYGVPPVPKIPRHVRLHSGEMLNTMIPRPQQTQLPQPPQTTKEPGDWPEDLEIF